MNEEMVSSLLLKIDQMHVQMQNNIAILQDMRQGQLDEVVVRHAEDRERGFAEKETNSEGNRPEVPECPICFEEMAPSVRIFQCRDGHLVCDVFTQFTQVEF